jgi:TRAP-type C4-dicarboxylate transport system substrate-binding protein
MYSGLEKGQLDCASNGANDMKTRSLWEVSKHATMVELGVYWAGYQYGINRDFWDSITPEQRRVLLDTIAEAIVNTGVGYIAEADAAVQEAPSHGVRIHEPESDLKQSIKEFARTARSNAVKLGKKKFGLADADGLIGRFEERTAKWKALLSGIDRQDHAALIALLKKELYDKIDVKSYGLN